MVLLVRGEDDLQAALLRSRRAAMCGDHTISPTTRPGGEEAAKWAAVIGDPALYASAGDSRIGEVDSEREGVSVTVELRIGFDKPHHTMIGLMALTGSPEFPAATTAFLSSLQIKPGEAPPAGDGT